MMHLSFSVLTISLILYNRPRCQLRDCMGHQDLKRKFKKVNFRYSINLYTKEMGGGKYFLEKGESSKISVK